MKINGFKINYPIHNWGIPKENPKSNGNTYIFMRVTQIIVYNYYNGHNFINSMPLYDATISKALCFTVLSANRFILSFSAFCSI